MRYAIGDEIILRIEDNFGYTDKTHRAVKVMIVGYSTDTDSSDLEYLCYVPPYSIIPGSFTLRTWHVKHFGMAPKFIGDDGYYVTGWSNIYKHIPAVPGEKCQRCNEFTPHAVLTNGTYRCQACKENPYR